MGDASHGAGGFDPYHRWLGVPPGERPPTHYRLLGVAADERDVEVIHAAALRQSAYVRNFQSGQHAADAARVLAELAEARTTLTDPARRKAYDSSLPAGVARPVPAPAPHLREVSSRSPSRTAGRPLIAGGLVLTFVVAGGVALRLRNPAPEGQTSVTPTGPASDPIDTAAKAPATRNGSAAVAEEKPSPTQADSAASQTPEDLRADKFAPTEDERAVAALVLGVGGGGTVDTPSGLAPLRDVVLGPATRFHVTSITLAHADRLTGEQLETIARLPHLYHFHGHSEKGFPARFLRLLAANPALAMVQLEDASMTDAGVGAIAGSRSLKNFSVRSSTITDAWLAPLSAMTQLKELDLRNCHRLTRDGVDRLRSQLPDCKVLDSIPAAPSPRPGAGAGAGGPAPASEPPSPTAWLKVVQRLEVHRLVHKDKDPRNWRHMTGSDAEARKAPKDGYWEPLGLLGYTSGRSLPATAALWRRHDGGNNRFSYYLGGGVPRAKADGILGFVWTEPRDGLVKVFVLREPSGNERMVTQQKNRDKGVREEGQRELFSFYLIPPDAK